MDATGFRALSEVLQVSEPDVVTQMRADYEHRGMAAADCHASQQRFIYEYRSEAWVEKAARMTRLWEEIRAEHPNVEQDIALDITIAHFRVNQFFQELVAKEGLMAFALGDVLADIQDDLRDGRLNTNLQHYLDSFQADFALYHASDCKFAQVGPVHGRWTDDGPVPKRRCTKNHECIWH